MGSSCTYRGVWQLALSGYGPTAIAFRATSSSTAKKRMPGSFFDTNVLLYIASADAAKAERAEKLLSGGGSISVQVVNEVVNVARRKMQLTWVETHELLALLRGLLTVHPLTVDQHKIGLVLAERYRLSTWDAMIAGAALDSGCDTLWSEDMQHGMMLEERLRIVNPFRTSSGTG